MYVKGPGGTLVDPPKPESGIFDDRYYLELLLAEVRRCPKVSRQAIVDSYKGGKRTLYQKAADSMSVPISLKDSYVKAFVKAEKINLTAKGDPAPRIIQPFSVRYNLELGRYLKFSEKRIMGAIDRVWGRPTILSGYNCDEQGEKIAGVWKQFRNPVAIGLDASRWDQHVSRQALVYEMSFYKALFPGDRYLSMLVDMQLDNRGIAIARDGCVRYSMPGRRMSGVPNTSMGNKILMTSMMHSLRRKLGVDFALINNGDDCVVIIESVHEELFTNSVEEHFLRYGIEMEVEPVTNQLEQLEFCQAHPVCIGGSWRMVRSLATSMAKDCYANISLRTAADCQSWLAAVGLCGVTINSGVPILQSFHNAFIRGSAGRKVSKLHLDRIIEYGNVERMRGISRGVVPVEGSSRVSFYRAFGVPPSVQVEMEGRFDALALSITGAPVETQHELPPSYPLCLLTSCLPKLPLKI